MFNIIFKKTIPKIYNHKMTFGSIIKFIGLMFFSIVLLTHSQADSFATKNIYKVNDLCNEALKYIDNKAYDKAIEKLLICQNAKRCASLLSDIYQLDDPAVKDINKSIHYQKILFGLGYEKAYHNIGFLYYKNSDIKNAKKYFRKSYEAGVYESLFSLGKIYEKEKKFDKAIALYTKASDQNISQADYSLALYYYKAKDINRTQYYFEKAAKQGFEPAKKALKQLKSI